LGPWFWAAEVHYARQKCRMLGLCYLDDAFKYRVSALLGVFMCFFSLAWVESRYMPRFREAR